MNINDVRKDIRSSSKTTNIYVGCDSGQRRSGKKQWHIKWVTVVCLHVDGCKGGYWHYDVKTEIRNERMSLRERIMREVYLSLDVALDIEKSVGPRLLEVHCDINQKMMEKSTVLLKEARGLIEGTGFLFQPKPTAFAATYVADEVLDKEWKKAGFRK